MTGLPGPAREAVRTESWKSFWCRQGSRCLLDRCSPHKTHLQTQPEPCNTVRVLGFNVSNLQHQTTDHVYLGVCCAPVKLSGHTQRWKLMQVPPF